MFSIHLIAFTLTELMCVLFLSLIWEYLHMDFISPLLGLQLISVLWICFGFSNLD